VYRHSLFLRPEGTAKMLVGEPPQARQTSRLVGINYAYSLWDKMSQSLSAPLCLLSPQSLATLRGPLSPKWRRGAPFVCGWSLPLQALNLRESRKSRGAVFDGSPDNILNAEMLTAFCENDAGYVIVLPPHKPRLETLENREVFRANFPHLNAFSNAP
jgi:hypothetical protein